MDLNTFKILPKMCNKPRILKINFKSNNYIKLQQIHIYY
jgi:hypothetical protein